MITNEHFIAMIQIAFQKHAPATIKSYNDELRFLAKFLKSKPLVLVGNIESQAYMRHLKDTVSCHDLKPLAPKTIKRKILTLYSIYDDAYNLDLVAMNPFEKVAKIARELRITHKREPQAVPYEQVPLILEDATGARNKALFSILFGGGLRVSEVVSLKKKDVKFLENGLIGLYVITAKTNKPRPVTLPEWASKNVKHYLKFHTKDWLFPNPNNGGVRPITRKWVSNLCYQTFGLRAHTARHTHISYLLSKGLPLPDIARAVGHESITSTLIYDRRVLDFNSSISKEADFFQSIEESSCYVKKSSL